MRLIDADALHEALMTKQKWVVRCGDKHNEGYTYDQVHFAIDEAPTIEAVSIDDYRSMENTCYKLQKALYEMTDRKTEPTISKIEQVEDEPQTEDGIMPEVKAGVRFDENNKTLWIKTDTVENYDRVIIEDGSNWCRIFYEECGECAHNKPRSNDEPQTDCSWR